jgi:shikimate kinase
MNIILIGMSGVGKTYLGKYISEKLNIPFYDTDELIIREHNTQLKDLIKNHSWEWFRNEEYLTLQKLNQMKNVIISTGGGIIENKNINELFNSHLIIYIKRNVNNEIKLQRCLSKSYDELYKEREPIYENLSKNIYNNDSNPNKFLDYINLIKSKSESPLPNK